MNRSTKEKMIAGAADLIRRRGVNATTMREVVRHTSTPRGSIRHHFPGGKQQLIEEALRYASREVADPLARLMDERGAVGGLKAFGASWRQILVSSQFQAGCPVLAVAVEPYVGDTKDATSECDGAEQAEHLLTLASDAFVTWQDVVSRALRREGVPPTRARRLAALAIASIEGALATCRAAKNAQGLDAVLTELEYVFEEAVANPN